MKQSGIDRFFWRGLLREPLLHFLLLGAAIFLLYQGQRPANVLADKEIRVDTGQVDQLIAGFTRTWQRSPSKQEAAGLVENFIREEIYYREALTLGLDRDDVMIRRRMQQKLEFILEDVAMSAEPSDAELKAFMAASAERYSHQPSFTFQQVFLNPAQRGEELATDTQLLLTRLNSETNLPKQPLPGDPSLLPPEVRDWPLTTVVSNFGEGFATALAGIEPGRWTGPLQSGLGTHLVKLLDYRPGRLAALADIREGVRSEWLAQRRNELADATYQQMRRQYKVVIDAPTLSAGPLAMHEADR